MTPAELARDNWRQDCNTYLSKRTGTYAFRTRRYDAVYDALCNLGVVEHDVVYDLGAGMCELDRRMREHALHLRYVPVDGCIDGTDLNYWMPPAADAFVLVEVIEHLPSAYLLLCRLKRQARKGIVITTPNADRVDVLAMDETHVRSFTAADLRAEDFEVEARQLFNDFDDTLIGAWRP